ncbi:C2 domain [Trinorchestia longiramus]|nr:C2 domain [Trinorchestia longiramus]
MVGRQQGILLQVSAGHVVSGMWWGDSKAFSCRSVLVMLCQACGGETARHSSAGQCWSCCVRYVVGRQQDILLQVSAGHVVSGTWWGDSKVFSCKMSTPDGSAKAVFGVSCNGPSFRQYLLDAKTLVLTLHTISRQDLTGKDLTHSKSDQPILSVEVSEEFLKDRSSMQNKILKPLNLSPSKRQQSASPRKRRSPPKSSVVSAGHLPEHLLGTPRHRLLEKQRTAWLPREEVGQVVVSNLKLNSRGELMTQCNVVNLFGDERGTLDVTMVYYENIALLKASLDEKEIFPLSQFSNTGFSSEKNKYLSSENKENVNCIPTYELRSPSVIHECSNVVTVSDPNEVSNLPTDDSCHISCDEITQPSEKRPYEMLLHDDNEFSTRRGSSVCVSDESVLAYLRQLDPRSLVECGAIREEDLPKFLKLMTDCTLDDDPPPDDSSVRDTAGSNYTRSIVKEHEDIKSGVPLISNRRNVVNSNYTSEILCDSNSNVSSRASCAENVHTNFLELFQFSHSASNEHADPKTGSYTARCADVISNACKDILLDTAQWSSPPSRDVGGTAAVSTTDTDCADVVCSEPSVISLPSGVWPLDGSPAFSRPPFHGAGEMKFSNGNQQDKEVTNRTNGEPSVNRTSKHSKLVEISSDRQSNSAQFSPSRRKILDDSLLTKLKYKAFTPDGKEIVMDCQRLAQLTRPSSHARDSHVIVTTSDLNWKAGENANQPHTSQAGSTMPQRKLWKNLKKNFDSSLSFDSQLALSNPHHRSTVLPDTFPGEIPSSLRTNEENSGAESDTSAASNETYTTSTLNNPDDSPTQASPGSVLLVEVKELTLRNASAAVQPSVRPGLKGVRNRSNVCILTSLTVCAPTLLLPCESELHDVLPASPCAPLSSHQLTPPQQHAPYHKQDLYQDNGPSAKSFISNKQVQYKDRMHGQMLPPTEIFAEEQLNIQEPVLSREGVLTQEQMLLRDEELSARQLGGGSLAPGDGGLQTITLASRQLDKDKVQYGSVQAFALSGLRDPAQLRKGTLIIRVYRRILGRQKSEELCSAEISLWDVYRLIHGHLVIPLSPVPSCSATATRHLSVDDFAIRCSSRPFPSRWSTESATGRDRITSLINKNIVQGSYKDSSIKDVVSPRRGGSSSRFGVGNVRSTNLDRDFSVGGGGLSVRGRGVKSLRGSKSNLVRNSNDAKPVSGEISIFLKLFLNEQYVNELRNSIVEDPSVMASFVQRRKYCAQQDFEDSAEADIVTVFPNLNRSETTKLVDHVTEHYNSERPNLRPTDHFSANCGSSKLTEASDNMAHDAPRINDNEGSQEPTLTHSSLQVASKNKVNKSYFSGQVVSTRDTCPESDPAGPKTFELSTEQQSKSMPRQVISESSTNLASESSTNLATEPLTRSKYESQTGRTFESSSRTLPGPSVTLLHQSKKEKESTLQKSSAPLECVLGSSDPSVSFIQTLSQRYHQNTEYFIRIHVEILEAKNLDSVADGTGCSVPPNAYVRASIFGEDVTTAVCGPSVSPVWNFTAQIVVSSFEINSSSNIVLRVHHSRADSAPLLGCLALRPPSPFWPGQVSLCGWYPLLNVRGRLAGHIKLSLTIVESVLGGGSALRTSPGSSVDPTDCTSTAVVSDPRFVFHTSQRQLSTTSKVDRLHESLRCPSSVSQSSDAPFAHRNSRNAVCSAQVLEKHEKYFSAAGSVSDVYDSRREVNPTNIVRQNCGVSDRINFTDAARESRTTHQDYLGCAVLEKRDLNDQVPLTNTANYSLSTWDKACLKNPKHERLARNSKEGDSLDDRLGFSNYFSHSNEAPYAYGERKGAVSEDCLVSRTNYLTTDNRSSLPSRGDEHSSDSLRAHASMSTLTNALSLPRRNISALSPPSSDLDPNSSCNRSRVEVLSGQELPSSSLSSYGFSTTSVTNKVLSAESNTNASDAHARTRQVKNDCRHPEQQHNIEISNDVLSVAPFPSCLRTVDSPRGLSKKVKFAEEKRSSWNPVSTIGGPCIDDLQNEILTSKYKETSCSYTSSSGVRERLVEHAQEPRRTVEEKSCCRRQESLARIEDKLCDIDQKSSSSLKEVEKLSYRDLESSSNDECFLNYLSENPDVELNELDFHVDQPCVDSCTTVPASRCEKTAEINRNISSLLESFSWMNLIKDNDSPCVSYIDSTKRPSTHSKNFRFRVDQNEQPKVHQFNESEASFNCMLKSSESPVVDSGLTSEIGSSSHRSSDADSARCVSISEFAGAACTPVLGVQTLLQHQVSTTSDPHLPARLNNNPKSRLAANFSFKKRPR